ncbi:hypothetical protein TL16_g13337, partial [Triparma laevis f. inornata]
WLLMYTHHTASIILVAGSYSINQERCGIMVLFLHQTSDIILNLCQSTHYLGWDSESFPGGVPVAEVLFVCNLVSWIITRLYLLPFTIIRSTIYEIEGTQGESTVRYLSFFLFFNKDELYLNRAKAAIKKIQDSEIRRQTTELQDDI